MASAEKDIGAGVVERLTRDLPPGTCVTCDRFFTTLKLAKKLIDAGKLGMKSGEGFRTWTAEQQTELRARVLAHLKAMNAADSR